MIKTKTKFKPLIGLCVLGVCLAGCHRENPDEKAFGTLIEKQDKNSKLHYYLDLDSNTNTTEAMIVVEQKDNVLWYDGLMMYRDTTNNTVKSVADWKKFANHSGGIFGTKYERAE